MSKLLNCLKRKDDSYVPVWFMRQAGRYLPEFRDIRLKNPDFLKLCLDSELSSEITLQPLKRYDLDAAIIFSDILVIPYALGQKVVFNNPGGPIIEDFNIDNFLNTSKKEFLTKLNPVYEAIKNTKKSIGKEKSLIAFIGAPWTLLIYLLNLKKGNLLNEKYLTNNKEKIDLILEKLTEFLNYHIISQIEAGADLLQIFDSWAGLLGPNQINKYCYKPNQKLVSFCKTNEIPMICFPKGIGKNYKKFVEIVKPDCVNIDYDINPVWARDNLENICIQGGMRPELLLKEEDLALQEVDKYLEVFKNNSYIFNLGHGILPQTDPEIVKKIIERVKHFNK